jgi:hypothetical protein
VIQVSQALDDKMKPKEIRATLADRVAETLSLFHDFPPIQPTKRHITYMRKGKETDYIEDERDISMLTKLNGNLIYLSSFSKALDITHPCEARTAFMEQLMRSTRSDEGWGTKMTIEAMKAVRPSSEEEGEEGRLKRFSNWLRGKKD